ncbi:unnamed protein product [Closterium sp. NIES-64]|nr:unnamed protein product [Closterium sp. NIES-64]
MLVPGLASSLCYFTLLPLLPVCPSPHTKPPPSPLPSAPLPYSLFVCGAPGGGQALREAERRARELEMESLLHPHSPHPHKTTTLPTPTKPPPHPHKTTSPPHKTTSPPPQNHHSPLFPASAEGEAGRRVRKLKMERESLRRGVAKHDLALGLMKRELQRTAHMLSAAADTRQALRSMKEQMEWMQEEARVKEERLAVLQEEFVSALKGNTFPSLVHASCMHA